MTLVFRNCILIFLPRWFNGVKPKRFESEVMNVDKCKKILEEQLQLLFEESKNHTTLEEKIEINKEMCRTAQVIVLLSHQSRFGEAGGTRQPSLRT